MSIKINEAIDHHDYACGIFLDLSKAFDTVNHDILIKKLEFYGVRGLANKWFSSYLSNQRQFVSVNNISSDELTISCGVPQGSVLGPLLFLVYVNDFPNCSKLLEFNLYADDSNLFYKSNTLLALQTDLNKELAEVYKWLCVNKLSLNIKKSNFVIFPPRQRKIETNVRIVINQQLLKQELSIKYLGVTLDSELSWKSHISFVENKIKRSIGILSKLRYYINLSTLKNLYYSLIVVLSL